MVISHVLYSRTHSSWVSHREGLTCNFNDFAIKLLPTHQNRERERASVKQGCVVTSGKLTVEKSTGHGGGGESLLLLLLLLSSSLWRSHDFTFDLLSCWLGPLFPQLEHENWSIFIVSKAKWRKSRLVIRFLVSRDIKRLSEHSLWVPLIFLI